MSQKGIDAIASGYI